MTVGGGGGEVNAPFSISVDQLKIISPQEVKG